MYTIPAGKRRLISTDILIQFPEGCYGRVAPRSSLAYVCRIDIGAGVIDRDYKGNVMVLMINNGTEEYHGSVIFTYFAVLC